MSEEEPVAAESAAKVSWPERMRRSWAALAVAAAVLVAAAAGVGYVVGDHTAGDNGSQRHGWMGPGGPGMTGPGRGFNGPPGMGQPQGRG